MNEHDATELAYNNGYLHCKEEVADIISKLIDETTDDSNVLLLEDIMEKVERLRCK